MAKRKVPIKLKFDLVDLLGRTPAPIQTQLLECTDFEVGCITGFAAGKTRGLVAKAMVHAVKYPGAKVAIGRKTFRETVNTVKQPAFIQWAPMYEAGWFTKPDEWVYTEGTNLVRLVNGSQIQFVNMSDPVKFRNEEFCVPYSTRALTRRGWKTADELVVGEDILTYNPRTQVKEWSPLLDLVRTTGEVIRLANTRMSISSTGGHRWFVKLKGTHGNVEGVRTTNELNSNMGIRINAPMADDSGTLSPGILQAEKYGEDWVARVASMTGPERRAWLSGFLVADGWQTEDGQWAWAQNLGSIADAALTAAFIEHDGMIGVNCHTPKKGRLIQNARLGKRNYVSVHALDRTSEGVQPVWCPVTANGSWIMRQGDWITITGNSLIVVDQAEEIDEPLFETLNGRARWPLVPAEARQIIAGANDDGHNWVWHRFVRWPQEHAIDPKRCMKTERCVFDDGHPDGNGNPQPDMPCVTRKFFHGTTLDNKMNLAPQYLAVLTSRPAAWQDQFVWAKMTGGTGRLLPALTEVEHFEPPKHWPRWYGMDHALQSPACGLWAAVNVDNHEVGGVNPQAVYIYREYHESDRTVDQHARDVLSLSRGERFVDRVLDRSAWQLNQQGKNGMRHSIADLYNEAGLLMSPSTGDPWARVERIKTAHANGMVVSKNCTHLLKSAPEYHSTATNVEGVVKIVNKTAFHAVDALGYVLMSIPMKVEPFDLPIGDVYEGPSSLESAHRMAEARRARVASEAVQVNEGLGMVGLVPANPLYEGSYATDFLGEDTEVADFNPYAEDESLWLS